MKSLFIHLSCILCFLVYACNNEKEKEWIPTNPNSIDTLQHIISENEPDSAFSNGICYEQKFGPKGRENIFRVNILEDKMEITGLLEYLFYGEAPIAGSIIGKREKSGEIIVLFNYVQEGKPQYQKVYFKQAGNYLLQRSGELIDKENYMDLKDINAPYRDTFIRTPCTKNFL